MAALALVALPGCNPVFAPPVRSTHGVAPRDLSAGGVEVMGAANVYGSGGPTLGVGVGSGLRVEAAGDFRQLDDNQNWAMGSAGVRYSVEARENRDDHGLSFDVGSGLGAGVGGADDIPRTVWGSGVVGLEVVLGPLSIPLATGVPATAIGSTASSAG